MISTVTIDDAHGPQRVTRSRIGDATACYYPRSRRVVLVADRGAFTDALHALTELRDHFGAELEDTEV